MAKGTETQFTDEALLAEVEEELGGMTEEELDAAAHEALVAQEVRKAKTRSRTQTEEQKEKQRRYNKKRNLKLKILAERAEEQGISVSEKEIQARLNAS